MIKVRQSFADLDYAKANLLTREDMVAVAQMIRQRIVERTARGVDASGQPFTPYSESYAKAKREALGTAGVDLTVSGEMLRAISYEVRPDNKGVSLFFAR